jgi:hypothetical protein
MKIYNLEVYMHPKLYMHEHFDLITNPFKYKCDFSSFYTSISKHCGECKM